MLESQFNAFLEAVKSDAGLQEKIKAATDADAVVAIARSAGFMSSVDDMNKAQSEIPLDELEAVTGGAPGNFMWGLLSIIIGGIDDRPYS